MFNVEKALEDIGTFGSWHLFSYFWIGYVVFFGGMITSCVVFMEDIPDFICTNKLSTLTNWTFKEIRSVTTPKFKTGDKFNGCKFYLRNYTDYANLSFSQASGLLTNETTATSTCNHGPYTWDLTGRMKLSIVNQWSLVCDQSFQVSNALTVYIVGFFFGCLLASFLGDRFGRKIVIVIFGTLSGIIGIADAYIPNIYGFLVGRFLILALEICADKVRKPVGALYFLFYSMGYTAVAGVAYAVRDWRILHAACSAPMLICPLLFWLLPESPRWLALKGREEEARRVLEKAARWNKRKIYPQPTEEVAFSKTPEALYGINSEELGTKETRSPPESSNFLVVFTHWKLALRTLNIFFNWVANAFVYYGIYFLITSFSGSIFVNNAISGAIETPSYLLCWPMLMWARKKSLMLLLLLAGVSCLLYLAVPEGLTWAQLLVAFAGKIAITASFNIIYLVTAELYPNMIRGASVSLGCMIGRVGSIIAPWVVLIAQQNRSLIWVAMTIFGLTSLVAGVLTFFIPESQNQPLPETLEEAINYPPKKRQEEEKQMIGSDNLSRAPLGLWRNHRM